MNNLEAFQDLKNILIENIENVILVKDKKILLNLLSLFELYKEDSKLRKLIDDYSCEFKDNQLSVDNLEERVEYIKNSEFDSFISNWMTKLFENYSLSVINFVLDRYFGSKNLYLNKQTIID